MKLRLWPGRIVVIDSVLLLPMPAIDVFQEGRAPLLLMGPDGHRHRLLFPLPVPS